MRKFLEAIPIASHSTILDIGGTPFIWTDFTPRPKITLCNQDQQIAESADAVDMAWISADGCHLPLADQSFEIVFSNSTIEHVGSWERQQQFAAEARRVGKSLWVQTPAKEFFIEPHLLTPWVHFFSRNWQKKWLRWLCLRSWLEGWNQSDVDEFLDEVRLISAEEMQLLFPDCLIYRERWLGSTKSYIAIRAATSR